MQMRDCYRIAERFLYRYRRNKAEADAFEEGCSYKADCMGGEGVKSSGISDPTARGGMRLAEPPDDVKELQRWTWSIETAWADLMHNEPPKARILEVYYGLNNMNGRRREDSLKVRLQVMEELHISERTFYNWKNDAVGAVIFAAIQKGALKPFNR